MKLNIKKKTHGNKNNRMAYIQQEKTLKRH